MEENKSDEIDLSQAFSLIKAMINSWIVSMLKAFEFIYKKKILLIVLIVIGAALGYFLQKNNKPEQKATALIRVNFDSVDYVYSEIEIINEKINEKDSLFFLNNGFRADTLELKEIEISPIVNLNDILEKYELNDRKLEGLLKSLEFDDEEIKVYETFNSEYKYHKIEFALTNIANKNTINNTLNYLNNNELLKQLRDTIISGVKTQIANNNKSIKQIDNVIDTYKSNQSLPSPNKQIFVVDKNFSLHVLFERKLDIQNLNESLNKFLVYAQDIVVLVNKPNIIVVKKGLFSNKIILIPFLFITIYLLFSYFRFLYLKLKKIAKNNM